MAASASSWHSGFSLGADLLLLFGVLIPLLPISGRIDPEIDVSLHSNFYLLEKSADGAFRHRQCACPSYDLPAVALALPFSALVARILKASLADAEDRTMHRSRAPAAFTSEILLARCFPMR